MNNFTKEKIAIEVIRTLASRFDKYPMDASNNRSAPFHEAFLTAFTDKIKDSISDIPFLFSINSWMIGFSGTLGQTFFENVAQHLSNGEKREYTSKRMGNLKITQTQRDRIAQIVADLSNSTKNPNLDEENALLFNEIDGAEINAMDFSADIFIEDADSITAIELKSVKPNSGEMKGEKQKILEGKAALHRKFPDKSINFFMGFPFDPTVNSDDEAVTSFNKTRFLEQIINMNKYFAPHESLVASELWDKLSGEEYTMELILDIINAIAKPDFLDKYNYLNDYMNRIINREKYELLLKSWFLFREANFIKNFSAVQSYVIANPTNKAARKYFFTPPFNKNFKYDDERINTLNNIIDLPPPDQITIKFE